MLVADAAKARGLDVATVQAWVDRGLLRSDFTLAALDVVIRERVADPKVLALVPEPTPATVPEETP